MVIKKFRRTFRISNTICPFMAVAVGGNGTFFGYFFGKVFAVKREKRERERERQSGRASDWEEGEEIEGNGKEEGGRLFGGIGISEKKKRKA